MELHALHQIVLGCFHNLKAATLQGVAERDSRGLSTDNRHGLGLLRLIAVNTLLCDRISARK